jgi:hypothetical protein
MGLKLRTSYILLVVSIVILAIGIIIITNHFTALRPPATPIITILADQTLVVPVGVENAPEVCFNVTSTGVLRGFIDVIDGQEISFYLYPEPSEPGWTVVEGESVFRSLFEVRLDKGRYKLIVVAYRSDQDDTNEDSIVNIYLEFES